jgi:hypothetical protein
MTANRKVRKVELAESNAAPVTDILARVAEELRTAAHRIDKTPIRADYAKERMASEDHEYVRAMQSLDHSAQMLGGLADFLSALADRAPDHWRIDPHPASQVVRLAELATKLSFRAVLADGNDAGSSNGDCEFF